MPVNLSIKNVPDHIAVQIRRRAVRHHRSLQGELVAILEQTVAQEKMLTPGDFLEKLHAIGLQTPDEAAKIIRKERNARSHR
jgi:plasmid stability protein